MFKRKVFAYVTHGSRLLVFRHPHHPEAGIQVPGGTVQDGEQPGDAVMREAREETGLLGLSLIALLGDETRDMSGHGIQEIHQRCFYQLQCAGDPPNTWQHYKSDPSDGTPHPILFEFFWADLPHAVPELSGDQGSMLPVLLGARNGRPQKRLT